MKEVLSSGATLEVSIAPIRTGYRLFQAVVREFKKEGMGFNVSMDDEIKSLKDLFGKNPQTFISGLLDVVSSDEVINIIMECGLSAVYTKNGKSQKVSMEAFEDEDNRGDFFEVLKIIAEKNLFPFFPKVRIS